MINPLVLIAFFSLVLAGCQNGPPACDDQRVLAAVKQLLIQKHVATTNSRLFGRRKADVLRLGTEWLEMASFNSIKTAGDHEGAGQIACSAKLSAPILPSILEKRRNTGFDAAWEKRTGKKPSVEPVLLEFNYSVSRSGEHPDGFLVKERIPAGRSDAAPFATLVSALEMARFERISATAAAFLGHWKGSFSCAGDVLVSYPEYKPPREWLAPYSQEIDLVIRSVFDIPSIPLDLFAQSRELAWATGFVRPALVVTIPYYTELERGVEGNARENAISFDSPDHGMLAVNLQGEVDGDRMQAAGIAKRGAGMLYSEKKCSVSMKRQGRLPFSPPAATSP